MAAIDVGITDARRAEITEKWEALQADVRGAETKAGREPGSVTILPVTKFHPASDVAVLAELGIDLVGENREQGRAARSRNSPPQE